MEGLPCKNEVKGSTLHQNPCLTDGSSGMDTAAAIQIDSVELVENSASMINVENDNFTGDDQETLLSTDDTRQEIIITSFDDCCGMEELPLPVLDSESMNEVEDSIKNDSEDNSSCLVRIEIIRQEEEEDTGRIMEEETKSANLFEEDEKGTSEEYVTEEEAVGAEKMTAETTVAILWVEDEEEEDSGEEYAMDEGDESSEETGSASAETNAEAIWPAGSIEVYCYWNSRTP
ncbi:cilia- and flagella-associated protein [Salix suchowensis]|nr:cilia- and flagella-associated protein [Salix suchowensis]